MTKEEYLNLAASQWDALQALQAADNFYDCEKNFDALWVVLGRQVLEKPVGTPCADRQAKKKPKAAMG